MLVRWLAHRTFTFALQVPPSLAEFLRYAVVGWSVAARQLRFVRADTCCCGPPPSRCSRSLSHRSLPTLFAYLGMRYGAFRG
jgi:hypothetical protein